MAQGRGAAPDPLCDEAAAIVVRSGPWESVETHRDLAGRDRFVIARA